MTWVASDILVPPVEKLMLVETVPLLVLMLWLRNGFRRGEMEPEGCSPCMVVVGCEWMLP